MRRLLFITAFALFLSIPLCAQRGGARGGGFGAHATFGGGHGGGFAGRGFSGARGGHFSGGTRGSFSRAPARSYNRGHNLHNGFRRGFHNGFHGRFHGRGFRNNCYGYYCGAGYGASLWGGYYDPWLWNWAYDDSRFDADYYNDLALANEMNQQSIEQQRMLRQEEADGDQDIYNSDRPHNSPNSAPAADAQASPTTPPTVLVFRDHHQQEIQNYAIVGQTLWIFGSPRNQRLQLSDLDLAATQKANDDRGVTFQPTNVSEGQ
jgi:hypothetical protein